MLKITYNSKIHKDGSCAQLQRIIGIFCIARHFKLDYIHSELNNIEHRYRASVDFLPIYNKIFSFNKHKCLKDCDLSNVKIVEAENISLDLIEQNRNKNVLLKICYPYAITDKFPDIYNYIYEYSFFDPKLKSKTIDIGVHIRRGDVTLIDHSDRYLQDEYYIWILNKIEEILLKRNLPFTITIYSEKGNYNFNKFLKYKTVQFKLDDNDIDTIKDLSYSDILVLSKSSYSYVAGLLNKTGLIVYCPFWHNKKSTWIFPISDKDLEIFLSNR